MGLKNLGRCLRRGGAGGVHRRHRRPTLARVLLGWARRTPAACHGRPRRIMRGGVYPAPAPERGSVQASAGRSWPPPSTDELAAILFTSGSTGRAQGRGLHARHLRRPGRAAAAIVRHRAGRDRPAARFRSSACSPRRLGMTAIVPEMDPTRPGQVDPRRSSEAIEHFGVTNLFGSPALLHRVGRAYGAAHGIRLPTLRRVISAGAPVPAKVIDATVRHARRRRPDLHPLRSHRGLAGGHHRQRRDIGPRPARRTAEGAGRLRRAGRSRA